LSESGFAGLLDLQDWVGNPSWKIVIPAKAGIQKLDTFVNVN